MSLSEEEKDEIFAEKNIVLYNVIGAVHDGKSVRGSSLVLSARKAIFLPVYSIKGSKEKAYCYPKYNIYGIAPDILSVADCFVDDMIFLWKEYIQTEEEALDESGKHLRRMLQKDWKEC